MDPLKSEDIPAEKVAHIDYTNHRGERGIRRVLPISFGWGANEFHSKPGWLLHCWDLDRQAYRTFSIRNVHAWVDAPAGPA